MQLHSVLLSDEAHTAEPTTECQQVQKDPTKLQQLNTKEDLIKAYPDIFEGIGHFPGIYNIRMMPSQLSMHNVAPGVR